MTPLVRECWNRCWEGVISGGHTMCNQIDGSETGHDFCEDGSSCGPSGCSSRCKPSGNECTAGGAGGNCRILADGTVICEEHQSLRTTNGVEWPETASSLTPVTCQV